MESFPKCDFIPVDYTDVRHIKSSFKKLMRACVPSAPYTDPEKGYLKGSVFERNKSPPTEESNENIQKA